MFYSSSTGGFYSSEIHGDNMPEDVVAITAEQHQALLNGQAQGKIIAANDNGEPVLQDRPAPTQAQVVAALTAAVQAHMDAAARQAGYDDIKSAVTYADEPAVPKFQAEGQAFRVWRSMVWARCYDLWDEVQAGNREPLTAAEVLAELPALNLPL